MVSPRITTFPLLAIATFIITLESALGPWLGLLIQDIVITFKMFGWIGNISPHNPRSPPLAQRQSVVGQMKDFLSGKFTPERLPSALKCILLR